MTAILWSVLWLLIRWALGVSKDFIVLAIKAVTAAQDLKHEDGTAYTGEEKRTYVLSKLEEGFSNICKDPDWKSTINAIVEVAVAYLKGAKTA